MRWLSRGHDSWHKSRLCVEITVRIFDSRDQSSDSPLLIRRRTAQARQSSWKCCCWRAAALAEVASVRREHKLSPYAAARVQPVPSLFKFCLGRYYVTNSGMACFLLAILSYWSLMRSSSQSCVLPIDMWTIFRLSRSVVFDPLPETTAVTTTTAQK